MMIKVLMIGNDSSVHGGITSVITQLLKHDWKKENVQMDFIPTYIDRNLFLKFCFFIYSYFRIKKYLKIKRPDIVHIHMSYKGSFYRAYLIHKLCIRKKIKVVVHLHGSEFEKWFNSITTNRQKRIKLFLRRVDILVVLGSKWKHKILRIEPSTRVAVVSNTVDIPSRLACWNENVFNILFLGVLINRKGVADLIEAISLLEEQNKLGNIRVIIAGNGSKFVELKNLVQEKGLENIVDFIGWVNREQKKRILASSQLLVLPSYNEGMPVSILEAISYGLPVIATDVGDINSAVINGKNGFLFQPGNIEVLADRIYQISHNKKLFQKMSRNSRQLAEKSFSSKNYFNVVSSIYRNLK